MANWFVAFKINPEGWYPRLLPQLPSETRIFHPADIHLTVAFLGQMDSSRIEPVMRTIQEFRFSPVTLSADRLLALPSARHFTAICLDFKNSDNGFNAVMENWKEAIFKAAGIPVDTRKFLAHATVCRPPRTMNRDTRDKILKAVMDASMLEITVSLDTLAIYTWADDRGHKDNSRQFKTVFERNFP